MHSQATAFGRHPSIAKQAVATLCALGLVASGCAVGSRPDAPPDAPGGLGAVDDILQQMELANIAFNAPKSLNYEDTADIKLVLGISTPVEELKGMIDAEGEKIGAEIKVSSRMKATLTGSGFEITPITPEVQAVSRAFVTEWKWEVKPTDHGHQRLHLNLSALITVDGETVPRSIRTFDATMDIEVTLAQKAQHFIENNFQWAWAALIVPVVGWLLTRRKKKKKKKGADKEDSDD